MNLQKLLLTLLGGLTLASCGGMHFANIPELSKSYSYIIIETSDPSLRRALHNALTARTMYIVTPSESHKRLEKIIAEVGAREARSSNSKVGNKDTSILSCQDNVSYSCIYNYLPRLTVENYSRYDKNIAIFNNGDVAEKLEVAEFRGGLYIPNLGIVNIEDITTDSVLNNDRAPLANIRHGERIDNLYYSRIAEVVSNKVIFVLEDLSN